MPASAAQITARRAQEDVQKNVYLQNCNPGGGGPTTIAGVQVTIFGEAGNALDGLHRKSIDTAVRDIVAAGHALPPLLFYLTSGAVPNVAMKTYNAGNPEPVIFLGPNMWAKNPKAAGPNPGVQGGIGTAGPRGVANQCYDGTTRFFGNPKQKAQGAAIVIHELGHILHEINSPGTFWEIQIQTEGQQPITSSPTWAGQAPKVSHYACNNCLEFVAETFTGILCGKNYDANVTAAYNGAGGA